MTLSPRLGLIPTLGVLVAGCGGQDKVETVPDEVVQRAPDVEPKTASDEIVKAMPEPSPESSRKMFDGCTRRVYPRAQVEEVTCERFVVNVNRTQTLDAESSLRALMKSDSGSDISAAFTLRVGATEYWAQHYRRRDPTMPRGYVAHSHGVAQTALALACADRGDYKDLSTSDCVRAMKAVLGGM